MGRSNRFANAIYGLAFRSGVMTFVKLGEMKYPDVSTRKPVDTIGTVQVSDEMGNVTELKQDAVPPAPGVGLKQGKLSLPPSLYQQKL